MSTQDKIMERVRELVSESGLTYQQVGLRMGYPQESARQSVWQFLQTSNPSIGQLRRFAGAIGVGLESLCSGD